jgi:antitoxin VapB
MNIKDPEVHRMAHELARRHGTTATGAVRDALRAALEADDRRARGDLAEILMDIGRRAAARGGTWLTDNDLYDDMGLPR